MTMRVLSVRGVLPEHRHRQEEITESFTTTLVEGTVDRGVAERFHRNACVETRHTVLPLAEYARLGDFGRANDVFIRAGTELGARAVVDALKGAGLTPADVDYIVSCTVTGLSVPSLEARVASEIGLRPDVVRLPLVGLGCVAGAAGLARLHDLLRGRPDGVAVLLSVELCSLTFQRDDTSVANLVAAGLFGDGAAAVVAVGPEHPLARSGDPARPEVLASRSRLYPDSERAMGWDVGSGGFRIVLDTSVPDLVRRHVGDDVRGFLTDHRLTGDDIGWYVAHPGGPKVLEALQDALGVGRDALRVTWDSLRRIGNLSSASVLHVMADTLAARPPGPGSHGLMLAMGPGFCSELVLLRAPGGEG
ncbi:3-oxoacyl-[acyl-carrier-protein] synthase III C-terminal domain-containing protein [Streptomyces sp. TRM 70361]|uniref:type III polyketide synthase n=1 Tax=Streptomyces sp. TRM 70361 TaxID=3116553 RepID=UPI002E7B87B7|nr:3-oxoacyl-[acyl-carrier-protein] synthase III C-terminal domain-containing protein [Streptomyces sp. TRM 70361]MEE1940054.1 3-oxoacyl-[acyl-carrier-protein] synthase III C-terminal domain-containing protein [Streptomyces sp. TRM 70361]